MATRNAVTCTTAWTLVYDAVAEGENFNGAIQKVGGDHAIGRVTNSATAPTAGISGFVIDEESTPISLSAVDLDRLWVRSYDSDVTVILG